MDGSRLREKTNLEESRDKQKKMVAKKEKIKQK
jgi:hypothetical protein